MIIWLIWCHSVGQIWSYWKENNTSIFMFPQRELPVLSDGSRRLEEHHPAQPVLQQQLPQNLQPAVQRRKEEVMFLAPDSGRPAAAEGRDLHADGRDLQTAGEEHGPPRWAWGKHPPVSLSKHRHRLCHRPQWLHVIEADLRELDVTVLSLSFCFRCNTDFACTVTAVVSDRCIIIKLYMQKVSSIMLHIIYEYVQFVWITADP